MPPQLSPHSQRPTSWRSLQCLSPAHLRGTPAPPSLSGQSWAPGSPQVSDTGARENDPGWGDGGRGGGETGRERDTAEDSEASHENERNRATKPRGGGETDRPRWPRLAGREAGAGTGGGGSPPAVGLAVGRSADSAPPRGTDAARTPPRPLAAPPRRPFWSLASSSAPEAAGDLPYLLRPPPAPVQP